MPRPAVRRNHLSKDTSTSSKEISTHNDITASKPASGEKGDTLRYQDRALKLGVTEQARNRSPILRSQERAIGSSPAEDHLTTDSCPRTRARGYSSSLSLGGRKGDMSSKIPGTPGFENSILSNFRRRPRKPSILQMMQAEGGFSDLDDDDNDDFLDGLSPEDERESSFRDSTVPLYQRIAEAKTSSWGPQAPQLSPDIVQSTQHDWEAPDNRDSEESAALNSPQLPENAEESSQTMVAPLSSSPISSSSHTVSVLGTGQLDSAGAVHTKRPVATNKVAVPLTTESLQGTLLPKRRQRRRKHKTTTDFEVPSDEDYDYADGPDDDELSYLPLKPLNLQRKQRPKSNALTGANAKPRPSINQKKRDKARVVETRGRGYKDATSRRGATTKLSKLPRETRTYSSYGLGREDTGKENRGVTVPAGSSLSVDSDASVRDSSARNPAPTPCFTSEELKFQAMKFAEVDKWEMEFEDVIISGSQASSSG
ncbi:hypothetical protein PHISCL_06524 [Aspergillus sclerotialis]|uniref:Uncharacterized protein n=1 Tax=Aspergillus sclerotialis TaxID=2070753 RepID=A0A3A2ZDC2_9EURO|nr:hypothetical protein PHISCL_06524 [Aspergillus sclerotialis]